MYVVSEPFYTNGTGSEPTEQPYNAGGLGRAVRRAVTIVASGDNICPHGQLMLLPG